MRIYRLIDIPDDNGISVNEEARNTDTGVSEIPVITIEHRFATFGGDLRRFRF